MFNNNHIVVLFDSSEDNQTALQKAERIALATGSKLTLFSSDYNSTLANRHLFEDDSGAEAQQAFVRRIQLGLEEKATELDSSLQADCVAVWDKHPAHALEQYLIQHPTDLVIKGTHHQNVMQRTFFSHTDWDLIRTCPVPLMLTKSESWNGNLKITAAVDPVHTNEKPATLDEQIINTAKLLSDKLSADLSLLHVYDPTPMLIYLDQPNADAGEISEHIEKQHKTALAELAKQAGFSDEQVHLETGSPATVIPDYLYQNNSQLVVMGVLSRHGLDRLVIGHTAERVLDRITADILLIKSKD